MNNKAPLVSVLVPAYNEEVFIRACLDSILAQNYPNFEVICFDDCSTDKTAEIVESIKDPRLVFIKNPNNEKHEKTWNYLLTIAKGEFIKTVCSDDVLDPDCLKESVDALLLHPEAIMSSCGKKIINSDGEVFYNSLPDNSKINGKTSHELMRNIFLTGSNIIGEPNNVLFRRIVIEKGIRYRFKNYWMVDPDFYLQLSELGNFVFVPKCLTSFRISLKSWSVIYSFKQASSFIRYIKQAHVREKYHFSNLEMMRATFNSYKLQFLRQIFYIFLISKTNFFNSSKK